jgi:hypothetical protein
MHGGEEFAHQCIETTVAAECDDLTRAVQRLDAVGLAQGGTDGASLLAVAARFYGCC